jgi:A/G-specific adenine glycosylase
MNYEHMLLNSNSIHPITTKLLAWYSVNKRNLPWREDPKPYNIWLAEIVFQQTRIDQGLSYYERLLEKFPNVYLLADAEEKEVLKVWEGLGYYSRARNLHASAKIIKEEYSGDFPSDYKNILALKGVGPYTAAAIASIAFKLPYPAIDGNVLRLISRLFAIEEAIDLPSTRKQIEAILEQMIVKDEPGDFNQAMMEMGALICKAQSPLCEHCPVSEHCLAYEKGLQSSIPFKKNKVKVGSVYMNYLVFHDRDSLLIERRREGIWKGLYQFPVIESELKLEDRAIMEELKKMTEKEVSGVLKSDLYKHILSHRIVHAQFFLIEVSDLDQFKGYLRIKKESLSEFPMPQLINRFLSSESAKQNLM